MQNGGGSMQMLAFAVESSTCVFMTDRMLVFARMRMLVFKFARMRMLVFKRLQGQSMLVFKRLQFE